MLCMNTQMFMCNREQCIVYMYWHKAGTQYVMYQYTGVYVQQSSVLCICTGTQQNTVCYVSIHRCLRATESSVLCIVLWYKDVCGGCKTSVDSAATEWKDFMYAEGMWNSRELLDNRMGNTLHKKKLTVERQGKTHRC